MRQERTLSDHPTRMVVPSQRSESRDPSFGVSPLTSTLTKFAPATPLTSTLTKTKDLKSFIINTYKKPGGDTPNSVAQPLQSLTSNLRSFLSPLDSALTSKRAAKSFTSNTYEKHTQGEGVGACFGSEHKSRVTNHGSRVTNHASQTAMVHSCRPLIGKRHDTV